MGCAELSLPEIAALAASWGLRETELRSVSGELDIPACAQRQGWLQQPLAATLGSPPLKIINFSSSIRLATDFPQAAQELAAYAPLAAHYQVPYLRVFDDGLNFPADAQRVWHWLDAWERLRLENDWHFDLLIETHSALNCTEAVASVFSRGHPHVHLLWDPHNVWKHTHAADPLADWEALKAHTRIIHIKDSIAAAGDSHGYHYVLPGEGEFPLLRLLEVLERDRYAGSVSLEWERLWHPQLPHIDTALAALSRVAARAHHLAS